MAIIETKTAENIIDFDPLPKGARLTQKNNQQDQTKT